MNQISQEGHRTVAVIVLLGAALVLTGVLTWQAADAARSHRQTAQRAVRDFAAIAADELIRRAANEIETYGFGPIRQAVSYDLAQGQPMDLAKLTVDADDRLKRALPLIDHRFMIDVKSRHIDPPINSALDVWLISQLLPIAQHRRQTGDPQMVRQTVGGTEYLIAYGLGHIDAGRLFGFVVNEREITPYLERVFSRRSIFPPSAGNGKLTNRDIFVSVSRGKREIFRSAGSFDPAFGVARTLSGDYGEIFRDANLRSSVRPSAAPLLVIGGVPKSRVPLLAVMLLTTTGVVIAALFLLRRERQLARLRSDFVSGVSHELRTPLTQIRPSLVVNDATASPPPRSLHLGRKRHQRYAVYF